VPDWHNGPVSAPAPTRSPRSLLGGQQAPVNIDLSTQQHYLVVSPCKIRSESCNHCCPACNVLREGAVSICNIAAGSGVGLGLRPGSGSASFGGEAQPLNTVEISAHNSVARRASLGECIGCLLGLCCVGGFGCGELSLQGQARDGLAGHLLGLGRDQSLVGELLAVQATGLQGQQHGQHQGSGLPGLGLDGFEHGYTPRHGKYFMRRECSGTVLRTCSRLMS